MIGWVGPANGWARVECTNVRTEIPVNIDLNVLKSICPKRLAWLPGVFRDSDSLPLLTYVEASTALVPSLYRLARTTNQAVSRGSLYRHCSLVSSCVRAVVRNSRYPVAFCVSSHNLDANRIVRLAVHPDYADEPLELHLLYLAALEQPEYPTRAWVRESDVPRQRRFAALDFKAVALDHHRKRILFEHPPLARRTPEAGEAGGPARDPAAGG